MNNLNDLKPQAVWSYFAGICSVPHPSNHEEAIRAHIKDFAAANGIECVEDQAHNIVLRKPATAGMEGRKGIILQAHLDMVPQKNSDKQFDFLKDGIEPYVDGQWVKARGTTLGADNGMGVAAIMAVFADNSLKHGPLEALLTATEEVGMNGAFGLQPGLLKGDILLNLDTENEGELVVGCAGGLDANIEFSYKEEPMPAGMAAQRLEIKGLKGGHSGLEIILERANACKLLNRFIYLAANEFGARIAAIDAGGLRNAIPREAFATIVVPQGKLTEFKAALADYEKMIVAEYKGVEDSISIKALDAELPASVIDAATQQGLLRAVYACPNGVIRMSQSMKGLVETSTNLARIVTEGGRIRLQCLMRSSSNSSKADLGEAIRSAFELGGAKVELSGGYGGWLPNMESPILSAMKASYKELYGKEPHVEGVHAGLECAIIGEPYPALDMISFGPTICFPHSPDEKVEIASVQKFWDFLCHALANAPRK